MSELSIIVKMPDAVFRIPAKIVSDEIIKAYPDDYVDGQLPDEEEIIDWAKSNMNWSDVEPHAVIHRKLSPEIDRQEHWANGEMYVLEAGVES